METIPLQDLLNACKKNLRFSEQNEEPHNNLENLGAENSNTFSPDEALALFLDLELTKAQYVQLRKALLNKNIDVLPKYEHITSAKTNCCPEFCVTETSASSDLQSVLDHTAKRFLKIKD